MVIAPLCQSINFSSIGHNQRLSAMLLNSSGLLNSTENSSLISNYKLLLFENSPQNLNILMHWTTAAQSALSNVKEAILSDPCLKRFDHLRLIVLRTNFASHGLSYVVYKPGDEEASTASIDAYQHGSEWQHGNIIYGGPPSGCFWCLAVPQ
jgi:hypothetical protein